MAPIHQAFLTAAWDAGYPRSDDANDPQNWGAGSQPLVGQPRSRCRRGRQCRRSGRRDVPGAEMSELVLHKVGPGCTVQDMGRPGQLSVGLSRGGAADTMALIEAAALLDLKAPVAGIEMAGMGLDLSVTAHHAVSLPRHVGLWYFAERQGGCSNHDIVD